MTVETTVETVETTTQEHAMTETVVDPKTGLIYHHQDGTVVPFFAPEDYIPFWRQDRDQTLNDIEIIRRPTARADRRVGVKAEPTLSEVVSQLIVELELMGGAPSGDFYAPSDETLGLVEELVDPAGTAMEVDVAQRLTQLFRSPEFNAINFPEMPAAHMRRLRWIATQRGFTNVREVLICVGDGHKFKALRGLGVQDAIDEVGKLLSRPGRVNPDAVASVAGVIARVSRDLRQQQAAVKKAETKAHRGSLYHNRTVMVWNGERMRFSQEFGAPSLLESIVEARKGPQTQPVSFQILNQDPAREPIPAKIRRELNNMGIMVIKDKAGVPIIRDTVPMKDRAAMMAALTTPDGQVNWAWVKANHKSLTPGALWLMATFSKSVDATYIPSLVTSPIEPGTFHATTAVFADICDDQGQSMGMDGGGWIPPFYDGQPLTNRQIRGEFMINPQTIAYVKGEGFIKWDACMIQYYDGSDPYESDWQPLWTEAQRAAVCQYLGMTDAEFREAYWAAAKASTSGYPVFNLKCKDSEWAGISFKMTPVIDQNQVKGNASSLIKGQVADGLIPQYEGYMGALRKEEGFSTMSFCFEGQQWTRFDPNDQGPVYTSAAKIAVDKAQRELAARLIDENSDPANPLAGIAAKMAQQDETVAVAMSVLMAFNRTMRQTKPGHKDVSWFHIPTLRTRVIRGLERSLYRGADGGGISCPQVVYQLCNRLKPGECVYTAASEGQEVMTYRFPMSTHTAMVVAQARPVQEYPELWEDPWGKVSKHRMIMSAGDLTFRMQGDDDGDKGGATTDPDLIAMARDTWEYRQIDIEVRATGQSAAKYNEPLWSVTPNIPMYNGRPVHHPKAGAKYEEYTSGMELAGRSRRGAVGMTTRLQQMLHAMAWQRRNGHWVYDAKAGERAIAMSWANQGEIDIEKKLILPIDMQTVLSQGLFPFQMEGELLVRAGALIDEEGTWRINPDLVARQPGAYDVMELNNIVKYQYLVAAGCFNPDPNKDRMDGDVFIPGVNPGNPIQWCSSDKVVDLTSTGWEGARHWPAGELEIDSIMHWSFRNMEEIWRNQIAPNIGFKLTDDGEIDYASMGMEGQVDFGDLLRQVLVAKGEKIIRRPAGWFDENRWQVMRSNMGVEAYNKSMADTYAITDSDGETEERKTEARSMAATKQQLLLRRRSLQDFADAWALESWQHNNMLNQAQQLEWEGQVVDAKKCRRAEGCLNSMIRLVNFPESPVAMTMEVTQMEVCDFLTKEVVDELVASVYVRTDRARTFEGLSNWIRTHGHRHANVLDHNAKSKHMTACVTCMTAAKQALVMKFRSDSQSGTAEYFKGLIQALNGR